MIKEEIYVETSVWNFIFADDAPEKKAATEAFFQHIVKLKTKREVRAVNTLLGFVVPEIITPEEYSYGI